MLLEITVGVAAVFAAEPVDVFSGGVHADVGFRRGILAVIRVGQLLCLELDLLIRVMGSDVARIVLALAADGAGIVIASGMLAGLRVGLKCGGSDGFSGITANPLVGEFSDWLVAQGGTSILTEVPEMFGAETILMNRCENKELFDKTVHLINDFKEYFLSHGEPVGENPSPGNKAGGISTLEDKALGCTQKCGRAPVSGVLQYGDRLETTGLNLLSAPGNDLVAATALASAGCQLVLFTTPQSPVICYA